MNTNAPLFLGIDGGATKTRAVVVDAAGNVRGEGEAGCGNHSAVGFAAATANIQDAAAIAVRRGGGMFPVVVARVGLAGVDRPADQERFAPALAPLARTVRLSNDAELGLSALPGGVGVVLIAGTGSIALGLDSSGARARVGGWGWRIGDEGSGYAMGRHALQAASQAADGRAPITALLTAILAKWHLNKPEDLIGYVYRDGGITNAEVAELAQIVLRSAREGDVAARRIARAAASDLAQMALAVAAVLDFDNRPLPLACVGGMLTGAEGVREMVLRRMRARRALAPVVVVTDPATAAAQSARALLGTTDS